jgi:hypothetical protein
LPGRQGFGSALIKCGSGCIIFIFADPDSISGV